MKPAKKSAAGKILSRILVFAMNLPKKICCFAVGRVFSMLTMLLAFVFILCLCTAVISWSPGFITGLFQVRSSVDNLFGEIGTRTQEFIKNMLEEHRKSALELKREYELGFLDVFNYDAIKLRLLTQSTTYKGSFISFAFSNIKWGTGELYVGVERGLLPGKKNEQIDEDVTTSFVTKFNNTDLFYYNIDKNNGSLLGKTKTSKNYSVKARGWYVESMTGDLHDGIWGTPYTTALSESLTTYIAFPLCNLTYTQSFSNWECQDNSARVGCVKSNVNLVLLSNYLADLDLPFSGFAVALESNGYYLASSVSIPFSATSRTRVEDITEKEIGKVMKSVRGYSDAKDPNKPFKFTKPQIFSVNGYALAVVPFSYGNGQIDWTVVLFFNEFTIYAFTYIYTLVTLFFLFAVIFVGLVLTCGFSCCFFWPFIQIQRSFKRIAAMDLNFKKMWSPITEINHIYISLEKMRLWLIEYKSFLPQHIQDMAEKSNKEKKKKKEKKIKAKDGKVAPNDSQRRGSVSSKSSKNKKDDKADTKSLQHSSIISSSKRGKDLKTNFQIGFNGQFISCLLVKVINYEEMTLDLSNSDEVQRDVSELYSLLDMLATSSKGHLASYSPSTHVIYWNVQLNKEDHRHLEKAFRTAIRAIDALKSKDMGMKFNLVIGQGFSYFGNIKIGMSRKTFEVIAPFVVFLERLSAMAKELGLNAVYPANIQSEVKTSNFLTRPVCKHFEKENEMVLHEFIGINEVKDDEWFYELKNKEENQKYEKFESAFNDIYSTDMNKVKEGQKALMELQSLFPNDEPFRRLMDKANQLIEGHPDGEDNDHYEEEEVTQN